jgi:hypothetical protein
MANKQGMKSCKKLGRAGRLAVHYKSVRPHRIAHARQMHLKHALQSCGKKFADQLRDYYTRYPISEVQPRCGRHITREQ